MPRCQAMPLVDPLESRIFFSGAGHTPTVLSAPSDNLYVVSEGVVYGHAAIDQITTSGNLSTLSVGLPFFIPKGITYDSSTSDLYVTDPKGKYTGIPGGLQAYGSAIFKVNATAGGKQLLSFNSPALGRHLRNPSQIVTGPNGMLYVADQDGGKDHLGSIVQIDPSTGIQTVVSTNSLATGKYLRHPRGIAIAPDGDIIVAEGHRRLSARGEILSIDPTTGAQTVITHNGLFTGNDLRHSIAVAVAPDGTIYVANPHTATLTGSILEIDPTTGAQTILTSGGHLKNPRAIVVGASGQIYVADFFTAAGYGGVIQIDPTTGVQTLDATISHAISISLGA